MTGDGASLINLTAFRRARMELGADFIRILGYFREDGQRAVTQIENAVRQADAVALVLPAHSLKGDSRQFGAIALGELAEELELVARRCVEHHERPDELIEPVIQLRALFEATMALLDKETNPLAERRPAFGRKAVA